LVGNSEVTGRATVAANATVALFAAEIGRLGLDRVLIGWAQQGVSDDELASSHHPLPVC
jgi:hypothetical protein